MSSILVIMESLRDFHPPQQERSMSILRPQSTGRAVLPVLTLWLLTYVGVRYTLESGLLVGPNLRLLLSLAPAPVFAVFLWTFVKAIRAADELERRIQLEALAVAFPLGLLLLSSLGLVQHAVDIDLQDWSYNHVWPMLVLFYIAGLGVTRRRYS